MTAPHGGPRPGAGRPALPEGEARTARLHTQLTPAEHADAVALAEAAGASRSDWLRGLVRQAVRAAANRP